MERAKKPQRLPTVLTVREVNAVLGKLAGTIGLMMRLLYGTRMRLMEYVRLRVKQVARVQHSGTPDFVSFHPGYLAEVCQKARYGREAMLIS
jgi:hypothetical protein